MSAVNSNPETNQNITIFVGGLLKSSNENTLLEYFCKYGNITDINLIRNWITGESKRCAIIFCGDEATFQRILSQRFHIVEGKKVRVSVADKEKKGTKIIKTDKIYVGNIKMHISDEDVKQYFKKFGQIAEYTSYVNSQGSENVKYAFIKFEDQNSAVNILNHRYEHFIKGCQLNCSPFRAKNQDPKLMQVFENIPGNDQQLWLSIIKGFYNEGQGQNEFLKSDPYNNSQPQYNQNPNYFGQSSEHKSSNNFVNYGYEKHNMSSDFQLYQRQNLYNGNYPKLANNFCKERNFPFYPNQQSNSLMNNNYKNLGNYWNDSQCYPGQERNYRTEWNQNFSYNQNFIDRSYENSDRNSFTKNFVDSKTNGFDKEYSPFCGSSLKNEKLGIRKTIDKGRCQPPGLDIKSSTFNSVEKIPSIENKCETQDGKEESENSPIILPLDLEDDVFDQKLFKAFFGPSHDMKSNDQSSEEDIFKNNTPAPKSVETMDSERESI